MKKKALMITVLLALVGFLLICVAMFFLHQGSLNADQRVSIAKKELEIAKKNIEQLNHEVINKISAIDSALNKSKQEGFNKIIDKNIPIIEITDIDLSRSDDEVSTGKKGKKVHKLMYTHQVRFYLFNIGKSSLQDVIFSIKDIYTDPKEIKKKSRIIGNTDEKDSKNTEIGTYENFEINTLPLKSRRLIYLSTLPSSFGVGDYEYHVIVEWNQGFYQMKIAIEEINGKLTYKYEFFDVDGNPIDFKNMESSIAN